MAVTYTRALQRDTQRQTVIAASAVEAAHVLLLATSLVAVLAVALAYEGRVRRLEALPPPAFPVFNLSAGTDANQLETALQPAFVAPSDRRFAAHELLGFVVAARDAGEELP